MSMHSYNAAPQARQDPAPPEARHAVDRVRRSHGGPRGTRLRVLLEAESASEESVRRPAAVAVQLALAITWDRALARGELPNRAAIASEAGITRARITQLMNLIFLAPDIQEDVLFLEAIDGVEPAGEHTLRQVLQAGLWPAQRAVWRQLVPRGGKV